LFFLNIIATLAALGPVETRLLTFLPLQQANSPWNLDRHSLICP
jgi:hypothetical protein